MNNTYNFEAKQTLYDNIYFRSKLEAQWAIVFDNCSIRWIYEPERFKGIEDTDYLPDFYFPDADLYVEVKGTDKQLFASARKISGALNRSTSPIAKSNGILILGPIPYDEDMLKFQDFGIMGSCLRYIENLNCIFDETFFMSSLKSNSDKLHIEDPYDATFIDFLRQVEMGGQYSDLDLKLPDFLSQYPEIPKTTSVNLHILKGTDSNNTTALCGGLIAARRARFDFNDSIKTMIEENRDIVGGDVK